MAVKLKDIAEKSGFSISTVSRILSNDTSRKSKQETIDKVVQVAQEMGYFEQRAFVPILGNSFQVFTLGCIFTSEHESFLSPFFSQILAGIQKEIHALGDRHQIVFSTFNIADSGYRQVISQSHLDGAIVLGRTTLENITFIKGHIPYLVYAGLNRIGQDFDEVLCDARKGVVKAVEYLYGLGHRSMGFIGPTLKKHPVFNEHRYAGFIDGLAFFGLKADPAFVYDSFLTALDGYEGMKEMIKSHKLPSAIICANDTVATGVLKALGEAGISVPSQVSVIGFDNIENAAFLNPSLTTIDVPKAELGRYATKILMDRILDKRIYPLQVKLPFSLIVRESTGPGPELPTEEAKS
ncbi:MAG TPA: LacI family DNA-binding transcriptional regulator [Sphaerochaeta sp.]|nr:LacI family DNA-binding transcriptional regulator [Sphaerochaeta sp.]